MGPFLEAERGTRLNFSAIYALYTPLEDEIFDGMAEWRKNTLAEWRNGAKSLGGMAEWLPLGNPPL